MESYTLNLSSLKKTWIFDIDGTLLKHNGYLQDNEEILNGVKNFFKNNIEKEDFVLLLTARNEKYRKVTEDFLLKNEINYNLIIYGLPCGERIIFNDKKETGLKTAYSINLERDLGLENIKIFKSL